MPQSSGESIEEIELRARAQRLEAAQELWASEFGWRNLALIGWPILAGIALLDLLVFALLGLSYPAWYIANGGLLSLGVPILSAVGIDLDRRYGLISAHPLYFSAAWLQIAADWSNIWEPTSAAPRYLVGTRWVHLDRVISAGLAKLLGFGLVALFLVAGPPQYLLNLVCGAPARSALASGKVVWDYLELDYQKGPDGSVTTNTWKENTTVLDATAPKPNEAAHLLGFDVKPVSVTYSLAAVVLFAVSALVH
jgi:hypothetical protein